MAPPEGLTIGSTSKPWTIGRILGSGACGSVHELLPSSNTKSSNQQRYAIKLATLPAAARSGNTKRKKTVQERNADLISHEYLTLQNLGPDVRGTYVPDIPYMGSPPAYGDLDGYRYLVMDRMSAPLHDIVSILLQDNKSSSTLVKIPIGDIAIQMLRCIQSLHSTGLVFIDVKSDNFMLAPPNNSKKNALAQRIRLIDFGLVESINDMTTAKHREDVEGSPLVGTPTYASLNVMEGHVPSRRDDLEALGYVICEVILNLVAIDKKGGKSKKKGISDTDNLLPWSKATSDVELLNFKKQEMDVKKRSKSQLFTMLKACGSDVVMGNYFNNVMALKYAATPDYESLCCYLKKLIVTVQSSNSVASAKSKSPVRKSPVRRSVTGKHHAKDEESDDDVIVIENPKSMAKSPVRKSSHRQVSSKTPNQQSDDIANDDNWNKKPAAKTKKQKVATAETASPPRRSTCNKSAREIATQTDPEDWMEAQDNESDPLSMDWEKVETDENEPPNSVARTPEQERATAQDVQYQDVLLEYSHLNSLITKQQSLLDAHIADLAYQRDLVEKQLAIENAVKEEMHERLLRGGEEGVVTEVAEESGIHESAGQNSAHLDAALQGEPKIEARSKLSEKKVSMAPSDSHDDFVTEAKSDKQQNKISERVQQKKPENTNLQVSRGTEHKSSATAPKKTASAFPQHFEEFIQAIRSNSTAENIIEQFNKTIKPVEDEAFLAAVNENQESVQENPKARQECHQKQLTTMNHRFEMYTKLEELMDKILSEESESSGRGRNPRSNSKSNDGKVTMELIQINLNNYRLLEDNMDRILGVNSSDWKHWWS